MNRPLNVLLVSPVGIHGGAEQVLLQLAKYLPQWNIEPMLACLRPGPLEDKARQQGLKTVVFNQNYRYRNLRTVVQAIRWLTCIIRQHEIDLVHSNFTAHIIGGPASRLVKVPEIWHHYDFPHRRTILEHITECIPCNYVIFATEKVQSGYPKLHLKPHSVIRPLCLEPEHLQGMVSRPDIREKYQLPAGPLFLTVARLQEHKGHSYLIDAVPSVLQQFPDAMFAIVGKASDREQEIYRERLLQQCQKLGISDRIRFLGYVGDKDLVTLYREATALVHPAISEGFGIALMEAMALGTPVIAADADGPQELIRPEVNGLLVPKANSSALAEAIIRVEQEPHLAGCLQRNGLLVAQQCKAEVMTQQTARVYRGLVKDSW